MKIFINGKEIKNYSNYENAFLNSKDIKTRKQVVQVLEQIGIDSNTLHLEQMCENGVLSYGLYTYGTDKAHIRVIKYYDENFYRVDIKGKKNATPN